MRILHRILLLPCNHLPVDVARKTPHRQKSRKEIRRESNHAPITLVEESSDDESEHYELNFAPEWQPELQTDYSAASVSEDIAWESATVSDRGVGEDGCSADEEQEHHPPVEETPPLPAASENEAGPSTPGSTIQEGASIAESRPQRDRRPPAVLTYDTLGNPVYQARAVVQSQCTVTIHSICSRSSSCVANKFTSYLAAPTTNDHAAISLISLSNDLWLPGDASSKAKLPSECWLPWTISSDLWTHGNAKPYIVRLLFDKKRKP